MFGSQILEVGIGLILVFLLVSLILTAVQEAIESLLKTRARDLEQAIAELLDDADGTGLRNELYNHPLVYALFPGGVTPTVFTKTGGIQERGRRNLPAYIPRETFALALEDLISQGKGSDKVHSAYAALDTASRGDAEKIRKGVEAWYDASMDRASGWFKRRTQWILFGLGLVVAVALNINAITIAQYLATNQTARAQMVKLAGEVDRENAEREKVQRDRTAQPTDTDASAPVGNDQAEAPANTAGSVPATPEAGSNEADAGADGGTPESNETNTSDGTGNTTTPPADAETPADAEAARIAEGLARRVREIGLPVGWDKVQVASIKAQFEDRNCWGWLATALTLLLGYLMVAFAATLGAPFWFDLLGKFMVVRSTVKPKEKSPDEASKDGGTGGSPKPKKEDEDDD